MGCLTDFKWHCTSVLAIKFTSPGEFITLVLVQPQTVPASVERSTGKSSKNFVSVDRRDRNEISTHIEVERKILSLVTLGPSSFLYMICPIGTYLWSKLSASTKVSCRTSIDLNGNGNKGFSKCYKKNKLFISKMVSCKRMKIKKWSEFGNKNSVFLENLFLFSDLCSEYHSWNKKERNFLAILLQTSKSRKLEKQNEYFAGLQGQEDERSFQNLVHMFKNRPVRGLVHLFQNQIKNLSPPQKEFWNIFHVFTEQFFSYYNTSIYT